MWAHTKHRAGFTIVELLIVVVVIAILAAITIVSYNGITRQADASALSSAASQTGKKVALHAVKNADTLPSSLAAIDITDTAKTAYTYIRGDVASKQFCVSAMKPGEPATAQAYTSASGGVEGECVENFILNPSFESGANSNGANISASSGTQSIVSGGAIQGKNFLRMIATSSASSGIGKGQFTKDLPNGRYTGSYWLRSNKPITFSLYTEGSSTRTNVSSTPGNSVTLTPNTWTRVSRTVDITSPGTIKFGGYCPSCNLLTVGTDYIDMDGFMVTQGETIYDYRDSGSAGWFATGATDNSTSIGPATF